MLIHFETHKDQDSLISSVEGVLPGVKQCLTKQTGVIEKTKTHIDKD